MWEISLSIFAKKRHKYVYVSLQETRKSSEHSVVRWTSLAVTNMKKSDHNLILFEITSLFHRKETHQTIWNCWLEFPLLSIFSLYTIITDTQQFGGLPKIRNLWLIPPTPFFIFFNFIIHDCYITSKLA